MQCDFADIGHNNNEEPDDLLDTNSLFLGKLLKINEVSSGGNWKYPPLFQEGLGGEIRVWQIGVEADEARLKIVHGILLTSKGEVGKNLQTVYHPVNLNKSGRDFNEQATLEARKRYMDKYKESYLPAGEEMPVEMNGTKPMLAKTYRPPEIEGKLKSTETRIKNFPVSVMRKIDGMRLLARYVGNKVHLRSRTNRTFPHLHHIRQELDTFLRYLPLHAELDGELYINDITFQGLTSVIKNETTLHKRHDDLQFWIFDLIEPERMSWGKRYRLLIEAFTRYIEDGHTCSSFKILQAYNAYNHEDIVKYHNSFVSQGYEGIMIRRYESVDGLKLSQYRSGRTNSLVKYKHFDDEEVTIIGVDTCSGTEEGAVKFIVQDIRGNTFPVRPKGTVSERREWFEKGSDFIGKPLTVRFQGLSDKGVPRFPVGIAVRDYE